MCDDIKKRSNITPLLAKAMTGQLEELTTEELFDTNNCRAKLAAVKAAEGHPVVKHRNGKIDLGILLDERVMREYVCHICHHSFAYRSVLDRHIKRIHMKHLMTKFKCPKCNYSTVWKDQMRSHFSVVHQNFKPYKCSECQFRAPKPCRVTSHILRCHNGVGHWSHDTEMKPLTIGPGRSTLTSTSKVDSVIVVSSSSSDDDAPPKIEVKDEVTYEVDLVSDTDPTFGDPKPDSEMLPESDSETLPDDTDDESVLPSFHCPFCDFQCARQLDMGEHVIETHEKAGNSNSPPSSSSKQIRSNHQLHECQICARKYQTPSTLEQHLRRDHKSRVILMVQRKIEK